MEGASLDSRVSRVEGQITTLTSIVEKMDKKLDSIAQGGRFTWQTLGVIVSIAMALLGFGAFFVNISIQPLSQSNQSEKKDLDDVHVTLSAYADKLSELSVKTERLGAANTEIETQFKATDESRNIQFANQLRFDALLWEKSYGTRFPSEIQYYPQISQKGP